MTGKYSVYTLYEGHEIMFHVSTLLPFSKDNRQQVNECTPKIMHLYSTCCRLVMMANFNDYNLDSNRCNRCNNPGTVRDTRIHY